MLKLLSEAKWDESAEPLDKSEGADRVSPARDSATVLQAGRQARSQDTCGRAAGVETYQAPSPGQVNVAVDPNSKRLQLLEPFAAWDGKDIEVTLPCVICCKGAEHRRRTLWKLSGVMASLGAQHECCCAVEAWRACIRPGACLLPLVGMSTWVQRDYMCV